jgi:hypothetical protein
MTSEQMARRRAGLNGLIGWHMVRRAKEAILTEDARSIGQAYQLKPPNLQHFLLHCPIIG